MKRYVLGLVLIGMLVPAAALCQEFDPEQMGMQMKLREKQMELDQREAKMQMEREMQKLELEERRFKRDHARGGHKPKLHPLLLLCLVVHILVAVWVYTDIRKRNLGSGIWIVIALLAGLLGVLVYAVVRIGDNKLKES